MPRSRRDLLRGCAASLSIALAGCSGRDRTGQTSSSTTPPTPTGSPTVECEADELPRPTPTAEGLEPLSYPDVPGDLTAETAREFAAEFERAYQHNRFLAGNPAGTDTVIVNAGVPDGFAIEDGGGYLVGVNATIATEDNRRPTGEGTVTPTQAPSYDDEFAAWYRLTSRRVRRKDVGHDLPETPEDVDVSDATTVLCA